MKKTAIYARANDEHELQRQIDELKKLALSNNGTDIEPANIFTDIASTVSPDLLGLSNLFDQVRDNRFEAILVFSFDRISRKRSETVELSLSLGLAGVNLLCANDLKVSQV